MINRLSDALFKLRILWWILSTNFSGWREDVWRKELDSHYCCNGRECCCGGDTIRNLWKYSHLDPPAAEER